MNSDTEALLRQVVTQMQNAIVSRDCPAVAALQGQRTLVMSDYDYLRDDATAEAFERRAATKAQEITATRWVLAVPQVWKEVDGGVAARAVSNLPLRPGEEEVITWMAFDVDDGVDYGFVPYTRRPNGEPVFDAVKLFTEPVQPDQDMPGFTLLTTLMHGDGPGAD